MLINADDPRQWTYLRIFFSFNFVRYVGWRSPTRRLSQNLATGQSERTLGKKFRIPAMAFWRCARSFCLNMTIFSFFPSKYGEFRTFFFPKKNSFVRLALPLFLSQYFCIIKKNLRFIYFLWGVVEGEPRVNFIFSGNFLKPIIELV
jgi:hypothetical protein